MQEKLTICSVSVSKAVWNLWYDAGIDALSCARLCKDPELLKKRPVSISYGWLVSSARVCITD